mmetsp:Transcript_32931/g.90929  ORF Transcript_32931/g.90929 Transcript_32931/m.90929 type:complete len:201 (+) Transcript_32931:957-1559(+)
MMAKPSVCSRCRASSVTVSPRHSSGPSSRMSAWPAKSASSGSAAKIDGKWPWSLGNVPRSSHTSPSQPERRPPTQRTLRPSTWSQSWQDGGAPNRSSSPGTRMAQHPSAPSGPTRAPLTTSAMTLGGKWKICGAAKSGRSRNGTRLPLARGMSQYTSAESPLLSGADEPQTLQPMVLKPMTCLAWRCRGQRRRLREHHAQ